VLYEETTGTLLCGDLFAQLGDGPAVTGASLVEAAIEAEGVLCSAAPGDVVPATLERLADFGPRTLAVMHGSSFEGDCAGTMQDLAVEWRGRWG
jgi:hypothetical protein